MKQKDKYKEPITIELPGMIARVYIPILDPKERERRMQKIYRSSARLMEGVRK